MEANKMKRILCLLICAALLLGNIPAAVFAADAIEINETTFPDENFRAWVLSQDYGQDGTF